MRNHPLGIVNSYGHKATRPPLVVGPCGSKAKGGGPRQGRHKVALRDLW